MAQALTNGRAATAPLLRLLLLASIALVGCSGGLQTPPDAEIFGESVRVQGGRVGTELQITLTLPPRAEGFVESYLIFVSLPGGKYERILEQAQFFRRDSSSEDQGSQREFTTELNEREQASDVMIRVHYSLWEQAAIHGGRQLFEGDRSITVARSE